MYAEIISIGDEILIGQVVNTNSAWLAEQLNLLGIKIAQITVVADIPANIIKSLDDASIRADLILITGGLGPTKDDRTKQTLCKYFNTKLVLNNDVYEDIEKFFAIRGIPITELNRKQAEVPENCKIFRNKTGTAPGMWFEKNGKVFVSMPGVPFEMKEMMRKYVLAEITNHFKTEAIFHKTILTQGKGESFLSDLIEEWETNLPDFIKLAYLPSPGIVRLRLSAYGKEKSKLISEVEKQVEKLKNIIPEFIYGYDNETLEEIVGNLLKSKNKTLSIAESCTGGYISHKITGISGSSDYFAGAVICYSNDVKINELGVSPVNIEKQGAVSEEVVIEMAKGVKEKLKTDYAVATSGIAGPTGGTDKKPIGTTWIAIASPHNVFAQKFLFGNNRERNIQRASITALNMLRKEILKNI
ncbi:MAG: competence/damage-inducible protein A [Bacteroidales bacterium]|nr:competence/damage-inducible protein A [Bacteroidales bacterium]